MTRIQIATKGFFLFMDFDPEDEDDQEILAEAYMLLLRRAGEGKGVNASAERFKSFRAQGAGIATLKTLSNNSSSRTRSLWR